MSTKHTPGPWVISSSVMGEDAITHIGETGDDNRHICTLPMLSRYSATGEEYKANAKLIAAAPELLAGLEMIAMALVKGYSRGWIEEYTIELLKKVGGELPTKG